MKIWPFDPYAEATGGHDISARTTCSRALEPFRKIRDAVGAEMDIMVEFHSLWDLPTAKRIARALEEFEPFWFEDPIKADNLDALAEFAASTRVPITASETLADALGLPRADRARAAAASSCSTSAGCGGISEAQEDRDAWPRRTSCRSRRTTAPARSCSSPRPTSRSTPPTRLIQESVRAFYTGWYRELVTELPVIADGHIAPPPGPGLGTELLPGLVTRPDATCAPAPSDRSSGLLNRPAVAVGIVEEDERAPRRTAGPR